MRRPRSLVRGLTIREVLIVSACVSLLGAISVPAMTGLRNTDLEQQSLNNLMLQGVGNAMYHLDYNGRQFTVPRDDLGFFGSTPFEALQQLEALDQPHPPIVTGISEQGDTYAFWFYSAGWSGTPHPGNAARVMPINFNPEGPIGYFRLTNVKAVHDYIGGRFYDPVFFAPGGVAYDVASQFFDAPAERPLAAPNAPYFSDYCYSAAALYDTEVLQAPSKGGFTWPFAQSPNPKILPPGSGWGFRSPNVSEALYPDLKTHIMEHNWVRNAPADCNPIFKHGIYDGCEPYYFNASIQVEPAALFFDGHVRIFSNIEAVASDATVLSQTDRVDGLWSRDTPLGEDGYLGGDLSLEGINMSHHVLTTNGIRGRDTIISGGTE